MGAWKSPCFYILSDYGEDNLSVRHVRVRGGESTYDEIVSFQERYSYDNAGKILCQFKSWKYCLQTWEQELQNFPVTALPATKPTIYKVWNESLLSGNASLCLDSSQNAMKFSQSSINADLFLPLCKALILKLSLSNINLSCPRRY